MGGGGVNVRLRFYKMSLMVHCYFEKGSQNQQFQSTLLGGRVGHKKEYSVYVFSSGKKANRLGSRNVSIKI